MICLPFSDCHIINSNFFHIRIQKRFWPTDNTDINRMFPGYDLGETTQRIAAGVFDTVKEYDYGIQFASFYMPGDFIPHVRMMETGYQNASLANLFGLQYVVNFVPHIRLMDEGYSRIETAMQFGLPYVVKRKVRPYDTATLNYNWQVWNTEAFSLYNGNRTD